MHYDCPFCHHESATLYRPKQCLRSGGTRDIYQCRECGLLYSRPRMDEDECLSYLRELYAGIGNKKWEDPSRALDRWKIRRWRDSRGTPLKAGLFLKRRLKTKGKALDIGTFTGEFCKILSFAGYEAYGLEPYDEAARFGRERGIQIFTGLFPNHVPGVLTSLRFSLITMLESIYYLVDLRKSLHIAYDMLEEGGHIFIKCHQGQSPYYAIENNSFFKRYGDAVQGIPTLKSIRYCLAKSGYDIMHISGVCIESASLSAFTKLIGKHNPLRKIFMPVGSMLTRFYESFIQDTEHADKIIVLARKAKRDAQ